MKYRIKTLDIAEKYRLPEPLPTKEDLKIERGITMLGKWLFLERIEFLENDQVTKTIEIPIDAPAFVTKAVYDGVEYDLVYNPLKKHKEDRLALMVSE